jgi:hypothetical protein
MEPAKINFEKKKQLVELDFSNLIFQQGERGHP